MSDNQDQVLVSILKTPDALPRARHERWYHIPLSQARTRLKKRWPPRWLAFYQGKTHGPEAFSIRHYAQVLSIRQTTRGQLFPNQPNHPKARLPYYKIELGPLKQLNKPILSRRWRRIVFIQTTWEKFTNAAEVNDLFDDSPLEDRLWAEFKRLTIPAERQQHVAVNDRDYFLDFAVYCADGKLDVETDGDTWHADPARIPLDNQRDNDLEIADWNLLRFNGLQVREKMADYCLPTIIDKVNQLGGVNEGATGPRQIHDDPAAGFQGSLFDDHPGLFDD